MTLRENTESPITITESTNRLNTEDILKNYNNIKSTGFTSRGKIPKLWDGKAATRIAKALSNLSC